MSLSDEGAHAAGAQAPDRHAAGANATGVPALPDFLVGSAHVFGFSYEAARAIAKRFQSAADMIEQIEQLLDGLAELDLDDEERDTIEEILTYDLSTLMFLSNTRYNIISV